jgi:hypothetical protein
MGMPFTATISLPVTIAFHVPCVTSFCSSACKLLLVIRLIVTNIVVLAAAAKLPEEIQPV